MIKYAAAILVIPEIVQECKSGTDEGDNSINRLFRNLKRPDQTHHSDTTLSYNNHLEAIKQWTNVFGVSQTPTTALTNTPISGWNRSRYGTKFEAIDAPVGHDIQVQANEVLGWFELNSTPDPRPTTTPPATTGSTISTSPPVSTTTTASGPEQTRWGQCGG